MSSADCSYQLTNAKWIHKSQHLMKQHCIFILLLWDMVNLLHGAGYSLKSWQSLNLSNNSLLSLWNPKVHYRAHKSPPPDPILSQPNSVRPNENYLPKVCLNVILPPTPRSSQWYLKWSWIINWNEAVFVYMKILSRNLLEWPKKVTESLHRSQRPGWNWKPPDITSANLIGKSRIFRIKPL
jgi:hypothetical protein